MKKVFTVLAVLVPLVFLGGHAYSRDGFESVQCSGDIPKALIGQHMSNERVVAIEGRHKALGLKDLGADEISDSLTAISWRICGKEFMLLEDERDIVRDVLAFPPHSTRAPEFLGTCQVHERDTPDIVVAVLDNSAGYETASALSDKRLFSATAAWKIDQAHARFVKIPADGLRCPRIGIISTDGGP